MSLLQMYMWVLNDDYERVRPLSKSNFHFAFIPIGRSQRLASFFIQQPGYVQTCLFPCDIDLEYVVSIRQ